MGKDRNRGSAKEKSKRKGWAGKKGEKLTARNADIHDLYQRSVQDPPTDIAFIDRIYKNEHGRKPRILREDFCGTAWMCACWVKGGKDRIALGLDLHQPTLNWGLAHNIEPLGEDAERVHLVRQNVLDKAPFKADVTAAFNFSYCVFKTRAEMLAYCRSARAGLRPGGAFILDMHGGVETTVNMEEETDHKAFTYVWDQDPFDAINGVGLRHIHFVFKDGTKIRRAFTYDWRMWTLPELRDVLLEAGFKRVDVYWEGSTKKGEGNGIFRLAKKAEQEDSWIAYIVAWR